MTTPNAGCSHSVYKGLHNIIYVTQWIKTLRISSYKDDGLFLLFGHKNNEDYSYKCIDLS